MPSLLHRNDASRDYAVLKRHLLWEAAHLYGALPLSRRYAEAIQHYESHQQDGGLHIEFRKSFSY